MVNTFQPRVSTVVSLLERLAAEVDLDDSTTPSDRPSLLEWTERYRSISGQPLQPRRIPWLRDLYDLSGPRYREVRIMKASQVFMSELMINTGLWVCDTGQGGRGNALYVMPTQGAANDFSQARIDTAINESGYLADRTGVVFEYAHGAVSRRRAAARVMLKRVGRGFFYIRGGDRRRQLLTVDADALLLDEADEFKRGVIDIARQRLNSSLDPIIRVASTPKYPSSGIAPLYADTSRRRYFLPCRTCGLKQPLEFPGNLTRDGKLVCVRCGGPISNTDHGEWVAEFGDAEVEGFHVNRLYSPRADLVELARTGYDIDDHLITDPDTIQEFKNQSLGLPHAPAGGALTDDILNACCQDYEVPASAAIGPVTMGVDVGGVLHWYIKAPAPDQDRNPGGTRLLAYGTAPNEDGPDGEPWPMLGHLIRQHRVRLTVVDAMPEDERSARFTQWWQGRAYRCFYHDETQWRYASASAWNATEYIVHAQRTRAMDATFQRFHHAEEELPRDARYHPMLYPHLKAPVRVLATDARGRTVARYQEGLSPDHLAHAAVYAELARIFVGAPSAPAEVSTSRPRKKKIRMGR